MQLLFRRKHCICYNYKHSSVRLPRPINRLMNELIKSHDNAKSNSRFQMHFYYSSANSEHNDAYDNY